MTTIHDSLSSVGDLVIIIVQDEEDEEQIKLSREIRREIQNLT